MSEFRVKHVKPELIRFRPIAFGWNKLESRIRINKSAYEPCRGDPIHMDTLARYPSPSGIRPSFLLCFVYGSLADLRFHFANGGLGLFSFRCRKEVDRLNLC